MATRRLDSRQRRVLVDVRAASGRTCRCTYCGTVLTRDTLTFDHRVPRALGGDASPANLLNACRHCNSARGTMDEAAFRALMGPVKAARLSGKPIPEIGPLPMLARDWRAEAIAKGLALLVEDRRYALPNGQVRVIGRGSAGRVNPAVLSEMLRRHWIERADPMPKEARAHAVYVYVVTAVGREAHSHGGH